MEASLSTSSLPTALATAAESEWPEGEEDSELLKAENIPKNIKYAIQLSANNPENPYIMQRALSVQQYDMLNSISNLQTMKTMKTGGPVKSKRSENSINSFVEKKNAPVSKESTFSLSSKLDVLEELLQNNRSVDDI